MDRFIGGRFQALLVLVPVAVVLAACSGMGDNSATMAESETEEQIASTVDLIEDIVVPSDEPLVYMTINVEATDTSFNPSTIFLSAGQAVKLVFRNRGTTEHHYRVLEMTSVGLQWLAGPEDVQLEGVTDEEHELHHTTGYMPFRVASPAGIKPIGDEVHAYAAPGDRDVVLFFPTSTGTFVVECALHPEIMGQVIVY